MGLTFYQTLEFDISSNYRGKASVQCFIGVSNHTHLTKLAYPDWLVNSWIINQFEKLVFNKSFLLFQTFYSHLFKFNIQTANSFNILASPKAEAGENPIKQRDTMSFSVSISPFCRSVAPFYSTLFIIIFFWLSVEGYHHHHYHHHHHHHHHHYHHYYYYYYYYYYYLLESLLLQQAHVEHGFKPMLQQKRE